MAEKCETLVILATLQAAKSFQSFPIFFHAHRLAQNFVEIPVPVA